MRDVTQIVAQLREELAAELRERVRRRLGEQSTEWLVDQLMALVLPSGEVSYAIPRQVPRGPEAGEGAYAPRVPIGEDVPGPVRVQDDPHAEAGRADARTCDDWVAGVGDEGGRAARIRRLGLDPASLPGYTARYRALRREVLEAEGYLLDAPPRGGALISPAHRSPKAEALLREAGDVLHGLLFGGEGVRLDPVDRGSITLAVPRAKAHAMAALVGVPGAGHVPGDGGPFRVEYGEVAGGLVGGALAAALCLVNDLMINERSLCGRAEDGGGAPGR
ncbi:hypothetical protein DQ384_18050 [Sphaerisporangium album]|uniref:Uncharacterized protein n=1 Tax=Sphaerisporangium album TaxID=509200 RepID=A0A367FI98_9ACTN|nr:hypothetical protein [Sphaerisporangium album]RCG30051.1 hypothetical protein DQ384_18050 [Sphaerisporangium album]